METVRWSECESASETAYADALVARDTARRTQVQAVQVTNRAAHDLALRDMSDWGVEGGNLDIVRVRIEQSLSAAATDADRQSAWKAWPHGNA